ncbi:glycosyltransferase family 2 protein [Candidatus Wolfebacteria bacterium]|nr:glycosyltransferase family 2 protein [Candidatus Wolfebacteria bacterium]
MKPYLSVIIPARNEAKRLPLTLIDIDKHLSRRDFSYEIIVVDNNSSDATPEIVRRFEHLIGNLRLLEHRSPGKGGAVTAGMLHAKGSIRLFMDADNATSIDQFDGMIPYFKQGYRVVIGSRDIAGSKLVPPQPWYKRLSGNMGNIYIQAMLLPGIWDTQCGFKAFTEEAALGIFPLLKTNRWAFDVEILALAKRLGFAIKEIPVTWVNDPFSQVKLTTYFQVLYEVAKIKIWFLTNSYAIDFKSAIGHND